MPRLRSGGLSFSHFQSCCFLLCFFLRFLRRLFLDLLFAFDQFHVGNMNWTLALGDFAARVILRFPKVLLDNAHAFNQNTLFSRKHRQDSPRRTAEIPRDNLDLVAFFDMKLYSIHRTSGASETIFMKLRSRSSLATGPKMRVPRGFKSLSIITIALLSKPSSEPSSRRVGCFVRTRTARTTSPFFTVPLSVASFTFAVITSPMPA